MKKTLLTVLWIAFALSFTAQAQPTTKVLTPLSSFGPHSDGTLRVGDATYITVDNYQRGIAYNPATGNLIFIDRETGNGSSIITGKIYILDPLTGNSLGTLNTNGMGGGNYADISVSVADDGAIYVCNMVNSAAAASSPFMIYRWDSETSGNAPTIVYTGDPAPGVTPRWGESFDVRGSGANTQIIAGSKTQNGGGGTNVVIFTASDAAATNFIAHRLITDLTSSDSGTSNEPGMSIAFGAGDTFWTKHKSGVPLRQMSFDIGNGTATTVRNFGTSALLNGANLGPIAVDTANNLMALGELTPNNTANNVRLYDISDLTKAPILLDLKTFPTAVINGTATGIYLEFGGGKLYAHSINNGIMASTVDTVQLNPPQIITQPSGTPRLPQGANISYSVFALQATSYQWQKNGVSIPGATNATLSLNNLVATNSGSYSVIVGNAADITQSTSVSLTVIAASELFRLNQLWTSTVGGAVNTLNPSATNYINQNGGANTPNQRTFAYDSTTSRLLMVNRTNSSSALFNIFVINATNGQYLYNLKTNGIGGGTIGLVGIAASDDGSIYACNVDNTGNWKLYRWADSGPSTLPSTVYSGSISGTGIRWGDVLSVRGTGGNTQIIVDNQNVNTSSQIALLTPTDSSLTSFTVKSSLIANDNFGGTVTTIGRSLQWGPDNGDGTYTFWQKRKGTNLVQSTLDPANMAFPAIQPINTSYVFPPTIGAVAIDFSRHLMAAIDFNGTVGSVPDSVSIYEVSDFANPIFLNRYNFTVNQFASSPNFICQIGFGGDYLFALEGNNGLSAFKVSAGPITPPSITTQSGDIRVVSGQTASISVNSPDATSYQWSKNGSNIVTGTTSTLTLANIKTSDAGTYMAVLSNSAGATTSAPVTVTVIASNTVFQLAKKWGYLPGTNAPGTFNNYVTYNGGMNTPNERCIAYNPLSNQLFVTQKSGSDFAVHVINADTGVEQYMLNTAGIFMAIPTINGASGLGIDAIGVAEDGAIYASALTPDACGCTNPDGIWRLYRWANSDPSTVPVQIFQGDPAGQSTSLRWGDVLSVRGAGLTTQIVVNNNQGTFGAVLTPTDSSMNAFTAAYYSQNGIGTPIGRSLQFSDLTPTSVWQKRSGMDLQLLDYDLVNHTSALLTNFNIFPASFGPVAVDFSRNLVIGINFAPNGNIPDTLDMYDISNLAAPTLILSRKDFPILHQPNANFIGQVILSGNKLFALSANSGLMALDLIPPTVDAPKVAATVSGTSVTLAWPSSATGFVLQSTATLDTPTWNNVNATVTTNGATCSVTVSTTGAQQYFRLVK